MVNVLFAAFLLVYAVIALRGAWLSLRRQTSARSGGPVEALLVRPCAGDEHGLEERLQATGGMRDVVFAVGSEGDAAYASVSRAATALGTRGVRARVVVTGAVGPNHKADQLARALAGTEHSVVVVADSDVALAQTQAEDLSRALLRSGAAAIWAPPVEAGPIHTLGDIVSHAVLNASMQSFPFLAGLDSEGFVGKLFAVRRQALDAVGGFGQLRHHLGEDTELARLLRARGMLTAVSPDPARAGVGGRSLRVVSRRYRRWVAILRAQRPLLLLTYPTLIAPLPFVAVASLAVDRRLVGGFVVVRLAIAWTARVLTRIPWKPWTPLTTLLLALIADLALMWALAQALLSRNVPWRNLVLRLRADGTIIEAP